MAEYEGFTPDDVELPDFAGAENVIFHGSADSDDWTWEVEYQDGSTAEGELGSFEGEPPEWVWDLYEWIEDETDASVEIDYKE